MLERRERDFAPHGPGVVAARANGGQFVRELHRARQVDPELLFVSGWNDFAFCLQIEPTVEYGFQYVDLLARCLGRETETLPYRQDSR